MIDSGALRKGMTIELEGNLYQVIDYQHIKIGRGSATVRLKLRNIRAGHTTERSFPASERFTRARLDHRTMQYLYNDGDLYYFMDVENYEQLPLSSSQLDNAISYLKEGLELAVLSYQDEIVSVELPITVALLVTETGPVFKGDTATAGTKPATLETGITIQVPMFINTGDIIKVDTRSDSYLERAG